MSETETKLALLPPKVLALTLLLQIPLAVASWPWKLRVIPLLVATAMFAIGVGLNIWAERLFRKNGVGVCPFSPVPTLINKGPYRFTRNPMYLGLALIAASSAIAFQLYGNLFFSAIFAVWLHFRYVIPEEEFLRRQFGVNYLEYAYSNPRWLGLPGRPAETPTAGTNANTSQAI